MSNNKGILQQIQENNNPKKNNKDFNTKEFRKKLQKMCEVDFKNANKQRELWLFEKALKQFHKALGDDGFYEMITSRPITTDSKGVKYIEKFEDKYEQK